MKKYYEVAIVTSNPSADMYGHFDTLKKAEKAISEAKLKIIKSPGHYGHIENCTFKIDLIEIDNLLQ